MPDKIETTEEAVIALLESMRVPTPAVLLAAELQGLGKILPNE